VDILWHFVTLNTDATTPGLPDFVGVEDVSKARALSHSKERGVSDSRSTRILTYISIYLAMES
jgi:hypothetical protein